MLAIFTFTLANLSYHIREDGHEWLARCSGEFIDTSPNEFPLRDDVSFLNKYPVELIFQMRRDGRLNRSMMAPGLDEQVEQWRREQYPCEGDVYVMRHFPAREKHSAMIGVTVALEEQKFMLVHDFASRHLGRKDVTAAAKCRFHGFNEKYAELPSLPTRREFMDGRHYFVSDDLSFVFDSGLS